MQKVHILLFYKKGDDGILLQLGSQAFRPLQWQQHNKVEILLLKEKALITITSKIPRVVKENTYLCSLQIGLVTWVRR